MNIFIALLATLLCSRVRLCDGTTFCVVGGVDSANNAIITIHSASQGWVGFGTGSRMAGSSMYVAWRNSTGGVVLSPRQASGNILPQISSERIASLVATPSSITTPSWAKISFSFKRPLAGIVTLTSSTSYIYAMSDSAPENPDSPAAAIGIHSQRRSLGPVDMTQSIDSPDQILSVGGGGPILSLPSGTTYDMILRTHGIIMFVAWVLCPAVGIFIARYLKNAMGVWWFRAHFMIMGVGTGLLTIAGITLVYLYKAPPHFDDSPHRVGGLVIGIAMVAQIVLGIVADRMFSPTRTAVPWWDKAHWWLGRGLAVLGILNVFGGILLFQSFGYPVSLVIKVLVSFTVGVVVAAFVYGEFRLGQVHHMAGKSYDPEQTALQSDGSYIPLH
ncbi:hypothetical protein HK105_206964 [Polyrhizophydium stewartii]|uniref:Cytochrome b561 domain-containing protein n=1 Tax=Polyrhizophydium stewartii TaxID=2732419 RepID=A0ABR4N1X3_9FUNG